MHHLDDITEIFRTVLAEAGSVDIADSEFKRMLADDPDLRTKYQEYCHDSGSSERRGFLDFCDEVMAEQDDVWNHLNEFEE